MFGLLSFIYYYVKYSCYSDQFLSCDGEFGYQGYVIKKKEDLSS